MSQDFQPANEVTSSIRSSTTGPSAFNRLAGIRQLPASMPNTPRLGQTPLSDQAPGSAIGGNRNYIRPEPRPTISTRKHEEDVSSGMGFSSYSSRPHSGFGAILKSEGPSSFQMPGSYRDDSPSTGDSDIEEIPNSAFYANVNRSSKASTPASGFRIQRQRPSFSPEAQPFEPPIASSTMSSYRGQSSMPHESYLGQIKTERAEYSQPGLMAPNFGSRSVYGPASQHFSNVPGYGDNGMNGAYGPGPGLGYSVNGSNGSGMQSRWPGYDHLSDMIQHRGTNFDELQGYLNLDDRYRGQLDYIVNDPRKSHQEIKELLENIRPDADVAPEDREGTPDGLKYPLVRRSFIITTFLANNP